jgi:hypothetical protein
MNPAGRVRIRNIMPIARAGACEKCWEMLGAAARRGLRRNCEEIDYLTVVPNDIKHLAVLCLNWYTPIPIWVCRHHREVDHASMASLMISMT